MLAAHDLGYGYGRRVIGSGVEFSLARGEVLCVLGPNGGGKTTLFRTLLGLLPRLGGRIEVCGEALERWSRNELARRVGYVPQQHAGYFSFSVRDIVLMGRTAHMGLFATPAAADHAAAARALATLGIEHLAEQSYTRISGGERQLALIARALAQGPQLLIMDEPTASLDFGNQLRVLEQLARLAGQGIGIVFSTHDPDQAFQCADLALLLAPGGMLRLGPPDQVITAATLRQLYGVEVTVVELEGTATGGRAARACLPSFRTH